MIILIIMTITTIIKTTLTIMTMKYNDSIDIT